VDEDYDTAAGPHPDFLAGMELLLPASVDVGAVELQQHQMYRSHQRLADSFRYGRVLLAGDAAHLSSTTGGMGLNSGIHDAVALAAAVAGPDPDRAASEYSDRRRLMAERFVQPATTLNRNAGDRLVIEARKERLAELRKIAEDEPSAREYLRNASMIGAQH
jgi:3-(3-hydroxy-phenyl)propionate hydroxylase